MLPVLTEPSLADRIRARALALGFAAAGIAPATTPASLDRYRRWLDAGQAGEMDYLTDPASVAARGDLAQILPGVRSAVVVALAYGRAAAPPPAAGRLASYAQGEDYHLVMKQRLLRLARELPALAGRPVVTRACVDTAPVLERDLAERAGLGFIGKNTVLIAPGRGSHFLIGELLTDLPLPATAEREAPRCGRCVTCLDACPTGALSEHSLDARLCISYLTIELRGMIPRELRPLIGTWVYGCDICQDVCPYNEGPAARARDPELAPRRPLAALDLARLITIGAAQFRKLVQRTALRRAPRAQLVRNACVAAGNVTDSAAHPALVDALCQALGDRSALVRQHAVWALGRLGGNKAHAALVRASEEESDPCIVEELVLALPPT